MKKQRIFPVYFNFKKPHYNLRSQNRVAAERPNKLADNKPIVPQANINNMAQAVTVRSQPAKFSGLPSENAQGWLDQFEAYCALNEVNDRNLVNEFKLLIAGPCQNWFYLLPADHKDTFVHLRQHFLNEYVTPANNFVDLQLFQSKKQKVDESVLSYINDMIAMGNKLQLPIENIIIAIQAGILPDLQAQVMIPNVAGITDLKQRAQLAEMLKHKSNVGLAKLPERNDDFETLKSTVAVLTKEVAKLQVHTVGLAHNDVAQQQATAPYYICQAQSEQQQQTHMPYCNRCLCTGHTPSQCRLQQTGPNQYNYNAYRPRLMHRPQNRPQNSSYGLTSNNYRPSYQNQTYSMRQSYRGNYGSNGNYGNYNFNSRPQYQNNYQRGTNNYQQRQNF